MSESIGTAGHVAAPAPAGRFKTIFGGAFGNFVEWYDFAIYGFLAGIFASQMFPAGDPTASLIASFLAFALGFIGRPIGAIVLSPLADKYGRRSMLGWTIILAGIGSLVIGLCPTYAQIGILAPILITAARLLQGFAAGGEFQIALTFLNEHAPSKYRAFGASPHLVSTGVAVLASTGIASLTTWLVPPDALASWGWRLPFLLGAVLSLYGFWLRSGLDETPSFKKAAAAAPITVKSIFSALAQYPKEAFIVFVVQMNGLQYYLWMIFLPTYANLIGGLDRASGFAGNMIATVIYILGVPTFALISDHIGRKPFFIAAATGFLVLSYPLLTMLQAPLTFGTYLLVAITGAVLISMNNGVLGTIFSEMFPTRVRTSGIGIPYAVCAAIFGGTAPAAATWLNGHGGPAYVAYYVMSVCVITLIVHLTLTPETLGRSLDD